MFRGRQVCKDFRGLSFADHQVEYSGTGHVTQVPHVSKMLMYLYIVTMQLCFLTLFRELKFRARQAYSKIYIPRKLRRIRYYIFEVTCPTLLVSYVHGGRCLIPYHGDEMKVNRYLNTV